MSAVGNWWWIQTSLQWIWPEDEREEERPMGCVMFFLVDQSRVVAFHCFAASQHQQRVFLLFTRRAESGRVESLTAIYPLAM